MNKHMILFLVGKDRPGIVDELSKLLFDQGANIEDSRMAVLGGCFCIMALFSFPIQRLDGIKNGLKDLEENEQIVFQYCNVNGELTKEANPNGSMDNIAGVCNLERNCLGLMPHPERATEAILSPYKTEHGKFFFESMIQFIKRRSS